MGEAILSLQRGSECRRDSLLVHLIVPIMWTLALLEVQAFLFSPAGWMPYGQYAYPQQQPYYGSQYDGSWDEGYDQYGHGGNFGGYGGQGGAQGGGRGGEESATT